jgi:hypothetical protein
MTHAATIPASGSIHIQPNMHARTVVGIAAAAGDFQSFPVYDGYLAAVVFDQAAFLQSAGRLGDANPVHAKHEA